jgi:hypothetical protein
MLACSKNRSRIIHFILTQNEFPLTLSDLRDPWPNHDEDGWCWYTPTHFFCEAGNLEIVKLLFSAGTLDDIIIPNLDLRTPFVLALRSGNKALVRFIIDTVVTYNIIGLHELFNMVDIKGKNSVHYACKFGYDDILRTMIHENASLRVEDYSFKSPLYLACKYRHHQIVEILMQTDALLDVMKTSLTFHFNSFYITLCLDDRRMADSLKNGLDKLSLLRSLPALINDAKIRNCYKILQWCFSLFESSIESLSLTLRLGFADALRLNDYKMMKFYLYDAISVDPQFLFDSVFKDSARKYCLSQPFFRSSCIFLKLIEFGVLIDYDSSVNGDAAAAILNSIQYFPFKDNFVQTCLYKINMSSSLNSLCRLKLNPDLLPIICSYLGDFETASRIFLETFLNFIYINCFEPIKRSRRRNFLIARIAAKKDYLIEGLSVMKNLVDSLKPKYDFRDRKKLKTY